ncbi:MAG: glycosyl hydrolase [Gemmatimonadetes bacterium]|nr:glycosyl hydrolase [Gemmatimonadota bacterium]
MTNILRPVLRRLAVAGLALCITHVAAAQRPRTPNAAVPSAVNRAADNPAYDPTLYTSPTATERAFKALRWRSVGPFRGGRVNAVVGDRQKPFLFYMGSVNGGVWRTANGGLSWDNITDGKSDISSVGAITVAPSDANVIYVGTGEAQLREDLTFGTGMYRSTDAGQSWQHLGLTEAQQITDIIVDPRDADRVYVSAIGHAFGPNPERGVFRTTDGGKSWKKVLFVDDSTGAQDLSMDPSNPRVIYAALYKFQRTPWSMNAGGGRSGLWKTTDGGDTWTDISKAPGIPRSVLGKIGVDVSRANPNRVYASIEAPDSTGGFFRSDDAGASWTRMNDDARMWVRNWYYSAVTADPKDENTVYVMNLSVLKSIDGGKTFNELDGQHGDTHQLWVDPADPKRMILADDGGASVTFDGGQSWSSQHTQPTAQFYHVNTDDRFPYRIYGAQQDNSAISIASRGDEGGIGIRDYFNVAGCENATIAPDPRDPDITYGGCYLGQLSRYDRRTRQERDISVTDINWDGYAAKDAPERFQWTFPILVSKHDPRTLYVTSQHVWRSRTEGASWERISPDLTAHEPATLERTGGPIHGEMTGAEWYATIYAFVESPKQAGVFWAGSDDGLIHVSRDNGATWQNVTPAGYGRLTRTAHIDASAHDAGTAYVAANRYQQDDFAPYLWKTTDFGRTWTKITNGIPRTAYTRVVREDPARRGLLYAGTEYGVWTSLDDGANWRPMQLNLPRVSVRDLKVQGNDLVAATHGRAFWVLDDLSPIRQLADSVTRKRVHLFQPATAVLWNGGGGGDGTGENPRSGVLVDWWISDSTTTKARVEFTDAQGAVLRHFVTADSASGADSISYQPSDSIVPVRRGTNRFVWNLRTRSAPKLPNTVIDFGTLRGAVVPPGEYGMRLIVGNDTLARRFTVVADPRVTSTTAELTAQYAAARRVVDRVTQIVDGVKRAEDLQSQLMDRAKRAADTSVARMLGDSARAVRTKIESVRAELYEVGCHVDQCTLDMPTKLYNKFITLNMQLQTGAYAPTKQSGEVYDGLKSRLDVQLRELDRIEREELARFNDLLQRNGIPPVFVPPMKPIA